MDFWEFMLARKQGGSGGGSSGGEEWIGDGNTHLWISLVEGRTSPMMGLNVKGTVTVDWGDGSTPDVLTGASTYVSDVVWTPTHEYAKAGDYVITLTVDGQIGLCGGSNGSYILTNGTSNSSIGRAYAGAIKKIEIGNNVTILNNYAFSFCCGLASVVLPVGITSLGKYIFDNCYSIASIVFPEGITSLDEYTLRNTYSLASIVFPKSITKISNYALQNLMACKYCDFTSHTSVPTMSGSYALQGIASDLEIRVPTALADAWKAATNWSRFASNIVGV